MLSSTSSSPRLKARNTADPFHTRAC
jgi:hypothetical protein